MRDYRVKPGNRTAASSIFKILAALRHRALLAVLTLALLVLNGCSGLVSSTATTAPAITAQPTNQTVIAGQTATFAVVATGTAPLSYQWQKGGGNIAGATSSSYTTPATTTADSGTTFRVAVSNSMGTVGSAAATLTVNAGAVAPTITTQPANQTVTAGQTATFTVVATGTAPLSYQWQKGGGNIAGATSSSYTTPATTTADSGTTFQVVVSNSTGSVTSAAAALTVNAGAVAPTITTQPSNQPITAGQTATFSVTANGTPPLNYQWSKNGGAISGATSLTYTTPAETTSDNGAQFSVLVSNAVGNVTSKPATLTVNAATHLLTVSPASLSFGNVPVGASATQKATLQNSGNSNVTISNISVSGPGFNPFGVPAGTILNPSQTATLNVTFAPAASGNTTGSVSVASDATNTPATITLSGSGQPTVPPGGTWISGYFGSGNGTLPPSSIPWTKYTHIIHFAAAPGVDSSGNGNGTVELHWLSQADINAVVASKPAGKQVLVCVKDNDSHLGAFAQSTSPGMIATFVSNISSFVNTNQYDGVDIDWEQNINVTQYEDLLTRLRAALPGKTITMTAGNWGGLDSVAGTSYSQVDQINVMCYDMDIGTGFSWYNDPLTQAGNTNVSACDWRVRPFLVGGVPAGKIGIGVPFYGRRWAGVTQALVSGNFSASTVKYRDLVTDTARWQPQYQGYDAKYESDYLSIPPLNEFDSFTGTQSINAAVSWQRSQGFGGFMTFTLDYEFLSGQAGDARYPLSAALCQSVFGSCP